jgi:hypothetical protein
VKVQQQQLHQQHIAEMRQAALGGAQVQPTQKKGSAPSLPRIARQGSALGFDEAAVRCYVFLQIFAAPHAMRIHYVAWAQRTPAQV